MFFGGLGKNSFNIANYVSKVMYNNLSKMVNSIRNNISDKKLFLCLDIETDEHKENNIKEIGWCTFNKNETIINKFYLVKENISNNNENQNCDQENKYLFGETKILELYEISQELKKDLEEVNYIISQRIENDINHFKVLNIDISKFKVMKDLIIPEYGIIDVNNIYSGIYHSDKINLEQCLIKTNIKYEKLGNAGNNANYIMQTFKNVVNQEKPEKYEIFNELITSIREKIDNEHLFLCLDIEAFEFDQKKLTEFGWCIFKKDGTLIKKIHALVKENLKFRNRKHVPDNKDHYLFGDSVTQQLKEIEEELKQDIDKVNYLVGQGIESDLRYLNSIKVNTSKFEKMKNSKIPLYGVIDTMDLYSGFYHTKGVGLEKSLNKLKIPYGRLHNAANDAIFTMQVFMKIINNSETVPLQLSPKEAEEIKKKEFIENSSKPKTSRKNNNNNNNSQKHQMKPKENKENGKFKGFNKIIKSIQHNISVNKLYLCLDIEAYEQDQNILTEFGWCVFKSDGTIVKVKHYIVEENINSRNGKYVPDNKDNFLFGKSETQKLKKIEDELKKDIEKINYLVGHGVKSDLIYLKSININTSKFETMKNSVIPEFGIIDTMDLYSGHFFTKGVNLEKSLTQLQIPFDKLHNAGNDAVFTMQVFQKIINNCNVVPLQIASQDKAKGNNIKFKNSNNKYNNNTYNNNNNNNIKISKPKKSKKEIERYREYSKIISAIKNNIGKKKLYLCLDIEAFEKNHDILTEFAWCMFKKDGTIVKKKHAIVKETMNYHNGDNVPDNRYDYLFGNSDIQELKTIEEELKKDIDQVNYLVGQGVGNDLHYLKSINVDTSKFEKMKNAKVPEYGIIDTMDLYSGIYYTPGVSLEKSLIKLRIPYEKLHNAGNDTIFTMQVFLKIITKCKKVPLQLSQPKIKNPINNNKDNKNGNDSTEKKVKRKKSKDETVKYKEYSKIIKAVKNNIAKNKLFLCLDIEAYEYDQKLLTEFGWCIFKKDGTIIKKKQAIVKENIDYHNGDHVPDHRYDYLFGKSDIQELKVIEEELKNDIETVNYLVGQGIGNDLRYLNSINVNTSKFEKMKNSQVPKYGIIDTMDLYSGLYFTNGVSLEKSLIKLQIPYDKLHNAGNDTIFTMQVFLKIINNCENVPLQLSDKKPIENNNETEIIKNETTTQIITPKPSLPKPKKENNIFQEYYKLINTIKYNISKDKIFLCLDIEVYESDPQIMTEFGWVIFKKDGTIIKNKHAIVKENKKYKNGKEIPDNKYNYLFGKSDTQKLSMIEDELKKDIKKVNYLVGQGVESDLRYLKSINVNTSNFVLMKNSKVHKYGLIDIMDLYSGLYLTESVNLEESLKKLQISYDKLHNA
eukprot:jgi/Orpsp1_1/1188299/evm.model.d7180000063731.1